MAIRVPADGRCLCETCCWERVREVTEAEANKAAWLGSTAYQSIPKRKGRTLNQIVEQWENLGKQEVE